MEFENIIQVNNDNFDNQEEVIEEVKPKRVYNSQVR